MLNLKPLAVGVVIAAASQALAAPPKQLGKPEGKHAYVASPAGAELEKAVATVNGTTPQDEFQLSHACAADGEETSGGTVKVGGGSQARDHSAIGEAPYIYAGSPPPAHRPPARGPTPAAT